MCSCVLTNFLKDDTSPVHKTRFGQCTLTRSQSATSELTFWAISSKLVWSPRRKRPCLAQRRHQSKEALLNLFFKKVHRRINFTLHSSAPKRQSLKVHRHLGSTYASATGIDIILYWYNGNSPADNLPYTNLSADNLSANNSPNVIK
jgi:hypothetical protein